MIAIYFAKTGLVASFVIGLIANIFMGSPLCYVYSMIGCLQYILYLGLLSTAFPGNVN